MDPAVVAGIGVIGTLSGVAVNELFASGRTSKTIGAQERQLARQLAHDRAVRDLEELREILDEAAAAAIRVNDNCITWVNHLATLDPNNVTEAQEALRFQRAVYEEIFGLSNSKVSLAFGRVRDSWAEAFKAVGGSRSLSPEEDERISGLMGKQRASMASSSSRPTRL